MDAIPVQVLSYIVLTDGISLETVSEAEACAHLRRKEMKISVKIRVPWRLSTRPHIGSGPTHSKSTPLTSDLCHHPVYH